MLPAVARSYASHGLARRGILKRAARGLLTAAAYTPRGFLMAGFATRAERDAARAAAASSLPAATVSHFASLFATLFEGLQSMAAANAGFSVAVSGDGLTLSITTGRENEEPWLLAGDLGTGFLLYSSFKVGEGASTKYKRDPATGAWVGLEDGHLLLELLARDLIHNSPSKGGLRGFPTF